ncbi:MAG: hypothetical protein Q8K99_02020 [Actinomycetota bacterium]|nr:hypothetical protein [Actinomycetota bacterium]
MDFGGILKRAWNITWRYKVLWIFGLLAGGAGRGGGNFNYNFGRGDLGQQQIDNLADFGSRIESALPVIIAVAVFLFIVGIGFWILSIAAQGGLVHLVSEAEESREVRAGLGWTAGFARWGRVFLLQLVLFLPILLILVIMSFVVFVPIILPIISGNEPSGASFLGACGGVIFGVLLLVVIGFIVSIVYNLALRYSVIDDVPAFAAIGQGWNDLKARFKDIFLMYLIVVAVGFAYGVVVGVVGVVFGITIGLAAAGGAYAVAGIVSFALFLLLLVPGAVYSTYVSSVWTLFFRELTGRGVPALQVAPAYGGPAVPPSVAPEYVPAPLGTPGEYVPAPPAPPSFTGDYMTPPPPPAPPAPAEPMAPAEPDSPDLPGSG